MPKNVLVIPSIVGGTSSGGGGSTVAVNSVNGKTGDVVLTKSDVGLGNVDNTSDLDKPISTATQQALDQKANKASTLAGYGITDVYTKTEADSKYATTAQGAKADTAVQPAAISDMLTKTEAGTTYAKTAELSTVAKTGSYNDLTDKPAAYSLPKASTTVLGGVKVDGTTITANAEGVITAVGGGSVPDNMVTTDTAQTISGNKKFTGNIQLGSTNMAILSVDGSPLIQSTTRGQEFGVPVNNTYIKSGQPVVIERNQTSYTNIDTGNLSENLPTATTATTGVVKPDGTTITVTTDGTISAVTSTPTNMVTTNTAQTITEDKTFTGASIIFTNNSDALKGNGGSTHLISTKAGAGVTVGDETKNLNLNGTSIRLNSTNLISGTPAKINSTFLPVSTTSAIGAVKPDGTTITVTAEGVISAPVVNTPVATTETAGIVKPSSLTFDVEEDGTLVNKVAGSNCYIYGLKGIGSDDITIAADTTTTIPVGRLRNYNYENGDRLKVGDMLIDLKGNVAKVDRVNTAVLPAGSGPFGVNESSVLVQLQTREDDTLTTSSKEIVGAINELKTATDSKTSKPASYAKAELPTASEHFGEFAIVTDQDNMLVWSNGTAWKQITLTDLA